MIVLREIDPAALRAHIGSATWAPIWVDGACIGTAYGPLLRSLLRVKGCTFALDAWRSCIVATWPKGRYVVVIAPERRRKPAVRETPGRPLLPRERAERDRIASYSRDAFDKAHKEAWQAADVERERMHRVERDEWDDDAGAWRSGPP